MLVFPDNILAVSMVSCVVNIDDAIEMKAVYCKCYLEIVACVIVHRNLVVDIDLVVKVVVVVACNWMVLEDRMVVVGLIHLQSNSLYQNYRNQLFRYLLHFSNNHVCLNFCMFCAKFIVFECV